MAKKHDIDVAEKIVVQDPVYSVKELIENSKALFDLEPECAVAALKRDGKSEYSVANAKKIIDEFMKKEVY